MPVDWPADNPFQWEQRHLRVAWAPGATASFPARLDELDAWAAPWSDRPATPGPAMPPEPAPRGVRQRSRTSGPARPLSPVAGLLADHPSTTEAVAALLGQGGEWSAPGLAASTGPVGPAGPDANAVAALLAAYPATVDAVHGLFSGVPVEG